MWMYVCICVCMCVCIQTVQHCIVLEGKHHDGFQGVTIFTKFKAMVSHLCYYLILGIVIYLTLNKKWPPHNNDYPITNNDYPTGTNGYPTTHNDYLTTNNDYSTTNNDYLTTNNDYSITNNDYPITDNDYPTTNNDYPITNNDYPITNNYYPITMAVPYQTMAAPYAFYITEKQLCHSPYSVTSTPSIMIEHYIYFSHRRCSLSCNCNHLARIENLRHNHVFKTEDLPDILG